MPRVRRIRRGPRQLQGALAQPGDSASRCRVSHLQHVFCEGAGLRVSRTSGHRLPSCTTPNNVVVVALVKGESGGPVERASLMTSVTGAVSSSMAPCPREVITRRRSARRSAGCGLQNVPCRSQGAFFASGAPWRRARGCAAESSSLASMPKRPRIQLAEPFMRRTSGDMTRVNASCAGATRRATVMAGMARPPAQLANHGQQGW